MISLDTIGMMIYFFIPSTLLGCRFIDRYGDFVGGVGRTVIAWLCLDRVPLEMDGEGRDDTLVLIMAMTTAMGVAVVNALCPMGGYLFARAYTHGQPNTKKVALCVKYSDLDDAVASLQSLEATKAILNIFVTLEDLQSNPNELKELVKMGHHVALASSRPLGFFTGFSFMHSKSASSNIEAAFNEYNQVFGQSASWVLSDSVISRHPTYLRRAHDLGMKVAYWSTLVEVKASTLSEEQRTFIVNDVVDKNGGSIIYITPDKGATKDSISTAITKIVGALDGFSIESLSQVVKDDTTMAL